MQSHDYGQNIQWTELYRTVHSCTLSVHCTGVLRDYSMMYCEFCTVTRTTVWQVVTMEIMSSSTDERQIQLSDMATNVDLSGIHSKEFVRTSINPDGLKNDYMQICKEANMRPTKFIEMSMRTANEEYTL